MSSMRKTAYSAALVGAALCIVNVDAQPAGMGGLLNEGSIKSAYWNSSGTWLLSEFEEKDVAGTITVAAGSITVAGANTYFKTELQTGQQLFNSAGSLIGTISAINSDGSLTLQSGAAVSVANGAFYTKVELVHEFVWDASNGNSYWAIRDEDCTIEHIWTTNDTTDGTKQSWTWETLDPKCAKPMLEDPCRMFKPNPTLDETPAKMYNCYNPIQYTGAGLFSTGTHSCSGLDRVGSGYSVQDTTSSDFKNKYGGLDLPDAPYVYANGDALCVCKCDLSDIEKETYQLEILGRIVPKNCKKLPQPSLLDTNLNASGIPQVTHNYIGTYSATNAQVLSQIGSGQFRFFTMGVNPITDNTLPTGFDAFDAQWPFWWDDYYVETKAGLPWSLAGFRVKSFKAGLPTYTQADGKQYPWSWQLPLTCTEDISPNQDLLADYVPEQAPVVTASKCDCPTYTNKNSDEKCCLAHNPPAALTYFTPTKEEFSDFKWTYNGIPWDNNPAMNKLTDGSKGDLNDVIRGVGTLGYVAAGVSLVLGPVGIGAVALAGVISGGAALLKFVADGIPQHRLWGTNFCARGNEFTSYARLRHGSANDFWGATDTNDMYGNPCSGENPKNGVAVPAGSANYNSNSHAGFITVRDSYQSTTTKQKRSKLKNKKLFDKLAPIIPAALKDLKISVATIRESTSDAEWAKAELPSNNAFNSNGQLIKAAQRLSRCRAVANFIDPDFRFLNGGQMTSGRDVPSASFGWPGTAYGKVHVNVNGVYQNDFDWAYYAAWPYVGQFINKRAYDNADEARKVNNKCENGQCYSFDVWCRQHDYVPIAYGAGSKDGADASVGTCHGDGRALFWQRAKNAAFAWRKQTTMLFGNFGVQPCYNLKLQCQERKGWGGCSNYGYKWKTSWSGKYHAGPKEGKVFSGPVARRDFEVESICIALRLPGEGVDGTVVPKIGNGICNCQYNNEWWGYDGGDCCPETCRRPAVGCFVSKGTIFVAAGSTNVQGSGTTFTKDYTVGQNIYTSSGSKIGKIASINGDSSITLTTGAASYSGAYLRDFEDSRPNPDCTQPDEKCDLAKFATMGSGWPGYNCKQAGCKPTAASPQNVGGFYDARKSENFVLDGRTPVTYTCP